jgi:hypothetical protein
MKAFINPTIFRSSEDVPLSIGLVLATSAGMTSNLALLKEAATPFVRTSNPNDEYLLVEFQQGARVVLPFTTDTDRVLEMIGRARARGSSPL